MKITRYFQSCLLIEEGGAKILIDPSGHEVDNLGKFGALNAVLYTHEHGDHFDAGMAGKFVDGGIAVYTNASTAKQMKSQPNIATDGQQFTVGSVKIQAKELPHCLMWDGSAGPQNTGYLLAGRFFHAGDGKELAGLSVDIAALPINGPDVSLKDAFDFAKQLSAKTIIPIHYDYLGGNPDVFADVGKSMGLTTKVLANGESADL
jgi:L-ascorbate metabolism protein UlaG (beta-lactamase superfamily)